MEKLVRIFKRSFNRRRGLGIDNAKSSELEDVTITTFGSGLNGKFCYVLTGAVKYNSEFEFEGHDGAYQAAYRHLRKEESR